MDITLALGGGGSRGYAHVGVLRSLESAGFHIRGISGSSAGGIVACIYAAGYTPDEMEFRFLKIDQSKLYSFTVHERSGLLGLSNAIILLEEFLGDRTFSDLLIPCTIVAVDLKTSREVILNKGRVIDAVLATIAVPGIFPPKLLGDLELVDGGVLDPVPVSAARSLAPHLPVAAVVLSKPLEKPGRLSQIPLPLKIPSSILNRLTHLRVAQAFSVFMQSVDIGQRMITELRLEVEKPDVVIRPDVDEIGLLDKVDVGRVIKLGEIAAELSLTELHKSVSWSRQLGRQLFHKKKNNRKNSQTR